MTPPSVPHNEPGPGQLLQTRDASDSGPRAASFSGIAELSTAWTVMRKSTKGPLGCKLQACAHITPLASTGHTGKPKFKRWGSTQTSEVAVRGVKN